MLLSTPRDEPLDRIYREIRPELLRYFRLRHGSDEAAEDLVQETFAAVLKNPARLLEAQSPRAYVFGVARHVSVDALRAARPMGPLEDKVEVRSEPEDPRLEGMRAAIAKLSPLLRQVLDLRLRQELSYQDIAGLLDIPIGTVRSRLHYAVKGLAAAMKSEDKP